MSKDTSLNTSLLSELSASFVAGSPDSSLIDLEDVMLCDIPEYLTSQGSTPLKIVYNGELIDSSVAYYKAEEIIDKILASPQLTITGGTDWLENNDYVKPANKYQNVDKEFHISSKYKGIDDHAYVDREIEGEADGELEEGQGMSSIGSADGDSYDTESGEECTAAIIEFGADTGDIPAEEYNIFVEPGDAIDDRTIIGECMQDGEMKPIRSIFSRGVIREDPDDGDFGRLYKTIASRHIIVDCFELAEGKSEDGIDMQDLNEDPQAFAELQSSLEKSEESMKLLLDFFPYLMYLRLVDSVADAALEEHDEYWSEEEEAAEESEESEEETVNPDEELVGEIDFGEYDPNDYSDYFISIFSDNIVEIPPSSAAYSYLESMLKEAWHQFYNSKSLNGLPLLYSKDNFPSIVDFYGETEDKEKGFKACCGWLAAMSLAEILPSKRNSLYKVGYELGGDKDTPIYKYEFYSDPNVARLVASCIWAAMRLKLREEFAASTYLEEKDLMAVMRSELGGDTYPRTASAIYDQITSEDGSWRDVREDFFIDASIMFPTAPGPYENPYYADRTVVGGMPYPSYSVGKGYDRELNLTIDREIYDYTVESYNLDQPDQEKFQRTVQAIADKETSVMHLFGEPREADIYEFNPVFGEHNIGITIDPEGLIGHLMTIVFQLSSASRFPLLDGRHYGRLRPGQWKSGKETILCNYYIEELDGHSSSYDDDGNLLPEGRIGPDRYCDYYEKNLYSAAYPSGHASGIWGVALSLIEVMPDKADKIMEAANLYSDSCVITRYHWNSDVIIGKVVASTIVPVIHATREYEDKVQGAVEELEEIQTSDTGN